MKKRAFQILDEMNVHDIEHKTRLVTLHPDVIEMKETKKGMQVTVGVPTGVLSIWKQQTGKQRVVLMIIDGHEFDERNV